MKWTEHEDRKPNPAGETTKALLWQVGGTDKAYLFSTVPKDRNGQGVVAWLPRSVIERITRRPRPGEWDECEVTAQLWALEKKNLI